tara:strand:- start:42 stop:308 length:267 start_codon:yes stop_codon:yes gene_type:complete
VSRRAFTKPVQQEYDSSFMDYFVSEVEYRDGLNVKKGERIEVDGAAVTNASSTSRTVEKTEIVLISPNGTKYKLRVADNGTISTEQVT